MSRFSKFASPRIPASLTACAGILLSVFGLSDGGGTCLTGFCTAQQSFTILGLSLWWFGLAAFSCLLILTLMGNLHLGSLIAGTVLVLDCLLLLLMLLSTPCVLCLFAAALYALLYHLISAPSQADRRIGTAQTRHLVLLTAWGLCFVMVSGQLVHNLAVPWVILGPRESNAMTARVFFSPSCRACRQLILSTSDVELPKISWCPVAEDAADIPVIARLDSLLQDGMTLKTALDAAHATLPEGKLASSIALQIRLLVNHAHVLAGGRDALPRIEFYGKPRLLLHHPDPQRVERPPLNGTPSFLEAPVNECGKARRCE